MIKWKDEMILYHGSYCSVRKPDLTMCRPNKDFGVGFYVTTSREQAVRFVESAVRKAKMSKTIDSNNQYGVVTSYRFTLTDKLTIKEFPTADADWLHCIANHRKPELSKKLNSEFESFDIISGKIANDQTNATLIAYLSGLYGVIGSPEADQTCISLLLPERLENQICFRTQKALDFLKYEGEDTIWIR